MQRRYWYVALVIMISSLLLAACAKQPEAAPEELPAQVEHLNGKAVSRVTLTPEAAGRLGVQTDVAQSEPEGSSVRIVVPYASILYDTEGHAWVYTNPAPLVYERVPVQVESIRGDDAVLVDGPASGTAVVTLGAEELFGSETEFEEE